MLKIEEIQQFITEDKTSEQKRLAAKGQDYYESDHDIRHLKFYYYNADGILVEDKTRSNVKIKHAFFTELVDQATQYILSGDEIVKSDIPELQKELDSYFNQNENFIAELSELLNGCQAKGFEYMYAYKDENDKLAFMCADSLGVVEARAKDTDDNCEYVIYYYTDRIGKNRKKIIKIQVWDKENVYYYVQDGESGKIELDNSENINPKPHTIYKIQGDNNTYYENFGYIPFFRLDNNKKRISNLKAIKEIIDDYDMVSSGLSNNLIDFDTPINVVKGYQGDSLDELQQNLKTKKIVAVDESGGIDREVIEVPFEARQAKLELDEKNIYRFGMGLNTAGLKDTAATTSIAIKAAYSLLDLKCKKLEIRIKQFLRKIVKAVIQEINDNNKKDYKLSDVYFEFKHEVMSNEQENAQIKLTEAQAQQVVINTLLAVAAKFDDETLMINICDALDIDYNEIKDKLPDPEDADESVESALDVIDNEQ